MSCAPRQEQSPSVSLADFQELRWLHGTWRGSGGNYPAFFEEYRFVDDSTIQMKSFADSTLAAVTDSSRIELRSGNVSSRSASSVYSVIALAADSVRFRPEGGRGGGHTFTRLSDDQWTATLHPASSGGQATVYQMRRIKP